MAGLASSVIENPPFFLAFNLVLFARKFNPMVAEGESVTEIRMPGNGVNR